MSLLDRLERTRFGKFGIPNLMRYVIGVNIVGILISLVNPTFYYSYLSLVLQVFCMDRFGVFLPLC